MVNFGTHLKNIRLSHNVTQKKLAQLIGTSERGIQRYELNESKPTYDMLIALADYFNVSIDYLVGRTDEQNSNYDMTIEAPLILSEKKEKLLQLFDALDDFNQGAILERTSMILEEQQKKETAKYKKSV